MSYRQGSPYDPRRDSSRYAEGWAYEHPRTGQPQPAPHPHHHIRSSAAPAPPTTP